MATLLTPKLQRIVCNLSTGRIRRVTLNGRKFIVAPLTLIVPGILNGSKGPLLYPQEEVVNSVQAWHDVPIVLYHPMRNGSPISAAEPDVWDKSGIGTVRNPVIRNSKLRGEGWFDEERTQRIDNRVYKALVEGRPIELSTGLFTDNEPNNAGATWNGQHYEFTARNYRADHLAILPDQVGACSINDGCGVLVNQEQTASFALSPAFVNNIWSDAAREAAAASRKAHSSGNKGLEAADLHKRAYLAHKAVVEDQSAPSHAKYAAVQEGNKHLHIKREIEGAHKQGLTYIGGIGTPNSGPEHSNTHVIPEGTKGTKGGTGPKLDMSKVAEARARAEATHRLMTGNKENPTVANRRTIWQKLGEVLGITNNEDAEPDKDEDDDEMTENSFWDDDEPIDNGGPGSGPRPGEHSALPHMHNLLEHAGYAHKDTFDDGSRHYSSKNSLNHSILINPDVSWKHIGPMSQVKGSGKGFDSLHSHLFPTANVDPAHAGVTPKRMVMDDNQEESEELTEGIPPDRRPGATKIVGKDKASFTSNEEGVTMDRKKVIGEIITNSCGCYVAGDEAVLNTMNDARLTKLHQHTMNAVENSTIVANATEELGTKKVSGFKGAAGPGSLGSAGSTGDEEAEDDREGAGEGGETLGAIPAVSPKKGKKAMTANEWMASAPPEVQSVVRNALQVEADEKNRLIKAITANAHNTFSPAALKSMGLEMLRPIAKGFSGAAQSQMPNIIQPPLYFGSEGAMPTGNSTAAEFVDNGSGDNDEILSMPTINWKDNEEELRKSNNRSA